MPNCQLIYDIPAQAENTTLERQEQKTRYARAQEGPLTRQDTRIKYIRSSAKTSPLERRFPPPRTYTKKYYPLERQSTRSSATARAQRNPLEREKHACRSSAEHQNSVSVQSPLERKKTRSSGPPKNWATKTRNQSLTNQ